MTRRKGGSVFLVLVAGLSVCSASADTKTVVAGTQYKASGTHEWLFGADYRALWLTPVTAEVLDLEREAGGLTPAFRVGGQQTKGLAFKGRDGRNYTFRGLDKDASELLEEDLRGTIVEKLLQDVQAAQHPASELVARGLLAAVGIPCPAWRLVVLPDAPGLGKFQKDFAGAIGVFAEYPSAASDTNPGFLGATEIIDHQELYKRLRAGNGDQADVRALLRARLVDIFMGDWDRHRKQWRWAKLPEGPLWVPIPEDRDQAFSRYEGLALALGRQRDPRFQNLGPRYAKLRGLATNGREQDRQLLAGLSREDFQKTAAELRAALSDEVIDKAVGLMPAEWRKLDAARLAGDLKPRRDALPQIADKFYLHLADRVDVYMTDQPERVEAQRLPNGDLELSVRRQRAGQAVDAPDFHRVFHPKETQEVRLYALGGDDQVVVTGGRSGIKIRVVGGPGNDTLDDSQGGGTKLSDSQGSNKVIAGPGTKQDDHAYTAPPGPKNAPWIPPQDFGSLTFSMPWISYGSDLGFFFGWGVDYRRFGFRKEPFASDHTFRAGWAFGEANGKVEYNGRLHRENRGTYYGLHAFASGVEVLRFYGFGNETTNTGGKDFYKAGEGQLLLHPSFGWGLGRHTALSLGPVVRYSSPQNRGGQLVDQLNPYGYSRFGQLGAHTALSFDSRDNVQYPRRGGILAARGTVWPKVWDASDSYGEVDGNANGYFSPANWLTLALRGGGKKVFGTYPYFDAATIGKGSLLTGALEEPGNTVRGFRSRRFSGDSSVYGNADLRLRVGRVTLIVPAHFGVFGLYDVGRVFFAGEDSNVWHSSYGGGIWLSFLNYGNTFSAYVAHSKEDNIFHVGGGFTF